MSTWHFPLCPLHYFHFAAMQRAIQTTIMRGPNHRQRNENSYTNSLYGLISYFSWISFSSISANKKWLWLWFLELQYLDPNVLHATWSCHPFKVARVKAFSWQPLTCQHLGCHWTDKLFGIGDKPGKAGIQASTCVFVDVLFLGGKDRLLQVFGGQSPN